MNEQDKHVRRPEILLIEDNPDDVDLTIEAIRRAGMENPVTIVNNGQTALDLLMKRGKYCDAKTPDLVLLDLNLPGIHGGEVLTAIKSDVALKRVPVIVLTTSDSPQDIARAYDLHANCYVTKPLSLDSFVDVVKRIREFWLLTATLPPQPPSSHY